jgi:hypothetical protein
MKPAKSYDQHVQSLRMRMATKCVKAASGCVEWTGRIDRWGYGRIRFMEHSAQQAHRMAYALTHNLPLPKFPGMVRHKCDNPKCVNPEHLEIGTNKDNVADAIQRGRRCYAPNRKLSERDVPLIRSDPRDCPAIAADFGVSTDGTVAHSVTGLDSGI